MYKVNVLLSTFNGEQFLREQMGSLLNQRDVETDILVRDDGSTDGTVGILQYYSSRHKNVHYYAGENAGPKNSFLNLMKNASKADFYAFCDQDDVWDPDKLSIAVRDVANTQKDEPCVYYSNLRVVDENLQFIRLFINEFYIMQDKYSLLVDNMAAGCTMVFNRRALEMILENPMHYLPMHDWMVHLVCAFFGKVIYDPEPHISYRQHSKNAVGADISSKYIKAIPKRVKRLFDSSQQPRFLAAKSFKEAYLTYLSDNEIARLDKIINYKKSIRNKWRLVIDREIRSPMRLRDISYRFLVIIGKA